MPNVGRRKLISSSSIERALAELHSQPPLSDENAASERLVLGFKRYFDAAPLSTEELEAHGLKPAREYHHFRMWQDRHNPEMVGAFEEQRRRWRERHDPKS